MRCDNISTYMKYRVRLPRLPTVGLIIFNTNFIELSSLSDKIMIADTCSKTYRSQYCTHFSHPVRHINDIILCVCWYRVLYYIIIHLDTYADATVMNHDVCVRVSENIMQRVL